MAEAPRSYSGWIAGAAVLMIAASFVVLTLVDGVGAYAITALVWGSILLSIALLIAARANTRSLQHREAMERLRENTARRDAYQEVLNRILEDGLPEGVSMADVHEALGGDVDEPGDDRK